MTRRKPTEMTKLIEELAKRIEAEPARADKKALESLESMTVGDPWARAYARSVFVQQWLAASCSQFSRELRAIITACTIVFALGACATDEPEPIPYCVDIGAPDSLLCTAGGLCSWEGQECCQKPAPGRPVDERCAR